VFAGVFRILQSSENRDNHVMCDVSEVADERRCLLDDAVNIVSSKISAYQEAYDRLGQWYADREVHRDEILDHISRSADQMRSLVERQRQKLGEEVYISSHLCLFERQQRKINRMIIGSC